MFGLWSVGGVAAVRTHVYFDEYITEKLNLDFGPTHVKLNYRLSESMGR